MRFVIHCSYCALFLVSFRFIVVHLRTFKRKKVRNFFKKSGKFNYVQDTLWCGHFQFHIAAKRRQKENIHGKNGSRQPLSARNNLQIKVSHIAIWPFSLQWIILMECNHFNYDVREFVEKWFHLDGDWVIKIDIIRRLFLFVCLTNE